MARQLLTDDIFPVRETDLDATGATDSTVTYWLRPITVDRAREIFKQHTRRVPDRVTRRRVDETNEPAVHDALLDYALVKWDGVLDGGAPAECSLENKKQLPGTIQAALIDRAQLGSDDEGAADAASFRQLA